MECRDCGNAQLLDEVENVITVGSAPDPELVLDRYDVDALAERP
jgi:hypothetical protein